MLGRMCLSTSHLFTKPHSEDTGPLQNTEKSGPMTYKLNQTKKQETHDAIYVTLLPPSAEVAKYGASSTELPLDLIRNEPRQELKGVPLWQQHYDEPQKQVLQKNSQTNGFTGALLTASTLKVMTYEGISSEVHIKASWVGK
jgi:hypothetical protein